MADDKTFAEKLTESRRAALLTTLSKMPAYSANERLLHDVVSDEGQPCSRDQIRSALAWLRDQDLIRVKVMAGVMVGSITQLGMDVASALVKVPGVASIDVD